MRATGRLLHRTIVAALWLAVLAGVAVGALSWRLSRGPVEFPWLVRQLEAAANAGEGGTKLRIGGAALEWEGFSGGFDRPLDLRVRDITVTDAAGTRLAGLPSALLSVSLRALLRGVILPRDIELDGARLRVVRDAAGTVTVDLGDLADTGGGGGGASFDAVLGELTRPLGNASDARWSELARLHVRDGAVVFVDRKLGMEWRAPDVDIDFRRGRAGGAEVTAAITLSLGSQTARMTAQAALAVNGTGGSVEARLGEIQPSALAAAAPALAPLAAVDAPLTVSGRAELGAGLAPLRGHVLAQLGRGAIHLGNGWMPVQAVSAEAEMTPDALDLRSLRAELLAHAGGTPSVITARVQARHAGTTIAATIDADIDQVAFADLPALWPVGLGGPGSRPWITANVTGGVARQGHVEAALTAPEDLSDAELTRLSGSLDGHDLTVWWLRPVPPIEHGEARLRFVDPDTIVVDVLGGRQGGGHPGLAISAGSVTLTGIAGHDQFAEIDGDIAGPVADLLDVLKNPRIRLLDRQPVELRDPAGQLAGHLRVGHLPLRDDLSMDDLAIVATAKLTGLHLGGIAAGHDLDHGALTMQASNDGLKVTGTADIAGIAAQLGVDMDFRAGPPSQELQRVTVSGSVEAKQLASLGVDTLGMLSGPANVSAVLRARRDGRGEIAARADLAAAALTVERLNWSKPAGKPATAEARVVLDHDRITGIEAIRLQGTDIDVSAQLGFAGGRASSVAFSRATLGPDNDFRGEVRFPPSAGTPWAVTLSGRSLDATAEFVRDPNAPQVKAQEKDKAGPPWSVEAKLDRIVTAERQNLRNVELSAESDGRIMRRAALKGNTGPDAPFALTIAPVAGGRTLTARAGDAGALLQAVDITDNMRGGTLTLSGRYDDARSDHALVGNAEITNFRIARAPGLAKLLQALTVYGVFELMQGPGMGFDELVAPFRLADDALTLNDARAHNASLGMTAKGRIDLHSQRCDLEGTIVPAYVVNSLLGRIPLLGRLFSPEKGGGLFAATYGLRGSCDDPSVSVNPLAAVTPGFLRGIFGIFDGASGPAPGSSPGAGRN